MKKVLLLLFFLLHVSSIVHSQSYLGYITKKVSMRDGPGKEYTVLMSLAKNTPVFLFSIETDNGYYHIIDIETNTEGYIPSTYIKSIEKLEKTSDKIFVPRGSTYSSYAEVYVYNNTSKTMTLKLNSEAYVFSPQEKKTINLTQGYYDFVASASGVIPNYGNKFFEKGIGYDWEFFIVSTRR